VVSGRFWKMIWEVDVEEVIPDSHIKINIENTSDSGIAQSV
jgi:hypothetical protein